MDLTRKILADCQEVFIERRKQQMAFRPGMGEEELAQGGGCVIS